MKMAAKIWKNYSFYGSCVLCWKIESEIFIPFILKEKNK